MTTNKLVIFLTRAVIAILTVGTFLIAAVLAGSPHNIKDMPENSRLFLFLLPLVFGYAFYLTFKKMRSNS